MKLSQEIATCLLLTAAVAHAQKFASIEVKPARSTDPASRVRVLTSGDMVATSVNAIGLICEGFYVPANPSGRLSKLPPWVYSDRYDIEAKASSDTKPIRPSDPDAAERVREILRKVLAEKFRFVVHVESRSMPVYALTVTGSALRLKESHPSDCIFDTAQDGCHNFAVGFGHPLNGNAINMEDLAHYIENWTDLPVVNRSSLIGVFTTRTEGWQPMNLPPPPPNTPENVDFTHLQTLDAMLGGLGLALHKDVASVQVYTVEQIKQP